MNVSEHVKEQPAPVDPEDPGAPDCWLLVMADMEARRRMGIERYGKPVRPGNGRDALTDAYQEALDMCVYLRQAIEERITMSEHECDNCGAAFALVPIAGKGVTHCPFCGSEAVKARQQEDAAAIKEKQRKAVEKAARRGFHGEEPAQLGK